MPMADHAHNRSCPPSDWCMGQLCTDQAAHPDSSEMLALGLGHMAAAGASEPGAWALEVAWKAARICGSICRAASRATGVLSDSRRPADGRGEALLCAAQAGCERVSVLLTCTSGSWTEVEAAVPHLQL